MSSGGDGDGGGDDTIRGGADGDRLFGQRDDDTLFGGASADALAGGAGDDMLVGGAGRDNLSGGSGDDHLYAGAGTTRRDAAKDRSGHVPKGGAGADRLCSRTGAIGGDRLYGDAGRDNFVVNGNDIVQDFERGDHVWAYATGAWDHVVVHGARGGANVSFVWGDGRSAVLTGETIKLKGGFSASEVMIAPLFGEAAVISLDAREADEAALQSLGAMFSPLGAEIGRIILRHGLSDAAVDKLEDTVLATLGRTEGFKAVAKVLTAEGANGVSGAFSAVAGTAIDHATGGFKDWSDAEIALAYGGAASLLILPLVASGTVVFAVGAAVSVGPALIDSYIEWQSDKYLRDVRVTARDLAEWDPAMEAEPAAQPPADDPFAF